MATATAHHLPMVAVPAPSLAAWIVARDGWVEPARPDGGLAELVHRAAGGDEDAFERLIRPSGGRLLGIARKILRDPDAAEDALQHAVIQAWRELPRLREPQRFDAWMTKLVVSACYQEARRSRRHAARIEHVASATPRQDSEPAADDDADLLADRELIEQAFLALTPAHRAVVVLHHYADLPLADVAAIIGVPPGTARSRLHYALRALRGALEAVDRPTIKDLPR